MNFIRNRNFRAGPQTSLEGFICPQNSDKQQKIKVFGRSGGEVQGCKNNKRKKENQKNERKFGNMPKKLYLCLLNVLYSSKGWF